MKKALLSLAIFLSLASTAYAKDWRVDYGHSKLSFVGDQNGTKFDGGFKVFSASIAFDTEHPEQGKISVKIDTASAYAGSEERDEMLPQGDWFNVPRFPHAEFTTNAIRKTSEGNYVADATLSIKGVTRDVSMPFSLLPEGDHWRAQGKLTLMRNDFEVGMGMFKGETYVKNAVDVIVDIVALPPA